MIDLSLFRIPAFSASLVVNLLTVFVAIGYFLFVAQYLQLVLEQSALEAGLWSLPSAVAFVAASQLAPRVLGRARPATVVAGGLVAAAAGMFVLATVSATEGLVALVLASVVISVGMGPVFGLTTEMVVGSAPAEKAGAASGISETAAELGGALGIAVLGSVGVALYRSGIAGALPQGVPAEAAAAAEDTLGAAAHVAAQLPAPVGGELLTVAREAFVTGMQVTSFSAGCVAVVIAVVAAVALRSTEPAAEPKPCPA